MSALTLTITSAGQSALAQAGTLGPVVLSKIAIGSGTWSTPPTSAATALKTQIKQLDPSGSSTPSAGIIHITATDSSSDAYNVYEIGLYTSTGILFAIAGGTSIFTSKASTSTALISLDISITNVAPDSLTIGDTGFTYPPATEITKGVAEIATTAETLAGVDDERLVTPKKLASYFIANGAGIATGKALADTIKTSIPSAIWDASVDGRYTYSATWYLTTGKTFISHAFNIPLGEVWEVEYDAPIHADTDDWLAWAWLLDGAISQVSPYYSTSSQTTFTSYGESISNTYKETLSAGNHTIVFKVASFNIGGASGPDKITISQKTPSYRIIRKYSESATSNQVLTGYALTDVSKSTQTIADWPRSGDARIPTWTSTWYTSNANLITTDTITVPVGQVWDIEYDCPIEMQSNDQYSTAWLLNGTPDSNTLLQTWLSANYQNAGFIPNQYKVTLQPGTHTIAFKFCIFGGSGTDIARFQFNNKVIRKYSSAATSAGVVSKAINGYCIMPNGLIMQWGRVNNYGGYQTITLPIPFPSAILWVSGTTGILSTGIDNNSTSAGINGTSLSTISVTDDGYGCNWFAIGY